LLTSSAGYVGTTIFGVVMLFFDTGADRQRIRPAGEYALATGSRDLFVQKRPDLERVLGDIGPLLEKFRAAARSPETHARREEALKGCEAVHADQARRNIEHLLDEQQRRINSVPLSPGSKSPYQVPQLGRGPVPPVNCSEIVVSDPDLEALATLTSTRDLVEILKRQSGANLKEALGLDIGTLTVEDMTTFLYQTLDGADIHATLDREHALLERHVADLRRDFDALLPNVTRRAGNLAWVRQFLWPNVLLCAFGLMLATKSYFKGSTSPKTKP